MNRDVAISKIQNDLKCDSKEAERLWGLLENVHDELKPSVEHWIDGSSDGFSLCGYSLDDVMKADNCKKIQAILRVNLFIDDPDRFSKYMAHMRTKE